MPGHRNAIFRSGSRKGSALLFAIAFASLAGCHSKLATVKPTIEITHVPIASLGGPDRMDDIDGRVTNARRGQQIVLYAHSGVWWVQPLTNQPYTRDCVGRELEERNPLRHRVCRAARHSGYRPASKFVSLPPEGDGVAAIAVFKGKSETASTRTVIHFSGYDWTVCATCSDHGGEPNAYDPANAWTDEKGYLHLRMAERNGRWTCAELSLDRRLGYGTYKIVVQDSAHLSPSAVLGMFTRDDKLSEGNRNELDIELSRWGVPNGKSAEYVVQPFYPPEKESRFTAPGGVLTHTFLWKPGIVTFRTVPGSSPTPGSKPLSEHVFTSGIPTPANETVHLDLYDFHHSEQPTTQSAEVVIERFEYLP